MYLLGNTLGYVSLNEVTNFTSTEGTMREKYSTIFTTNEMTTWNKNNTYIFINTYLAYTFLL